MDFHVTRSDGLAPTLLKRLAADEDGGPWYVQVDYWLPADNLIQGPITQYGYLDPWDGCTPNDDEIVLHLCGETRIDLEQPVTIALDSIVSVTVPC